MDYGMHDLIHLTGFLYFSKKTSNNLSAFNAPLHTSPQKLIDIVKEVWMPPTIKPNCYFIPEPERHYLIG